MKISQLEEHLASIKKIHGDIEVYVYVSDRVWQFSPLETNELVIDKEVDGSHILNIGEI